MDTSLDFPCYHSLATFDKFDLFGCLIKPLPAIESVSASHSDCTPIVQQKVIVAAIRQYNIAVVVPHMFPLKML